MLETKQMKLNHNLPVSASAQTKQTNSSHLESDVVSLSIPCAPEYVAVARLTVSGIATRMNFSIEDIEDIKIAVSEACTNAIQYAYDDSYTHPVVKIICFLNDKDLEIHVVDHGQGFDPENAGKNEKTPDKNHMPSLGLGLTFIKSLMDKAEINSELGAGTTIKMFKRV